MESKPFWQSKTFWINVIAAAALVAQGQFGWVFSPETQASVLVVINLVLRFVTKEEITWS